MAEVAKDLGPPLMDFKDGRCEIQQKQSLLPCVVEQGPPCDTWLWSQDHKPHKGFVIKKSK